MSLEEKASDSIDDEDINSSEEEPILHTEEQSEEPITPLEDTATENITASPVEREPQVEVEENGSLSPAPDRLERMPTETEEHNVVPEPSLVVLESVEPPYKEHEPLPTVEPLDNALATEFIPQVESPVKDLTAEDDCTESNSDDAEAATTSLQTESTPLEVKELEYVISSKAVIAETDERPMATEIEMKNESLSGEVAARALEDPAIAHVVEIDRQETTGSPQTLSIRTEEKPPTTVVEQALEASPTLAIDESDCDLVHDMDIPQEPSGECIQEEVMSEQSEDENASPTITSPTVFFSIAGTRDDSSKHIITTERLYSRGISSDAIPT